MANKCPFCGSVIYTLDITATIPDGTYETKSGQYDIELDKIEWDDEEDPIELKKYDITYTCPECGEELTPELFKDDGYYDDIDDVEDEEEEEEAQDESQDDSIESIESIPKPKPKPKPTKSTKPTKKSPHRLRKKRAT
jgi:ribosomal protein L44E